MFNLQKAMYDIYNGDIYEGSKLLYKELDFSIESNPLEKEDRKKDIIDFLVNTDKLKVLNMIELDYINKILSISSLFNMYLDNDRKDEILFVALCLESDIRDRSFDALIITKILSLKVFNSNVLYLFNFDNYILFSGYLEGDVYLSSWFDTLNPSIETLHEISQMKLSNIPLLSNKQLYKDLLFSISRYYMVYVESTEYLKYGNIGFDFRLNNYLDNNEIFESRKESQKNKWNDDLVDTIDALFVSDDLSNKSDDLLDDLLENKNHFVDKIEKNSEKDIKDFDNNFQSNEMFDSPSKLLDWLNKH